MEQKKKSFSLDKLLEKKNNLRIFAIVLAIFCWEVVVLTVNPNTTDTKREVPIDYSLMQEAVMESLNLELIEADTAVVNATVHGSRTVVGRLQPEDLAATLRYSSVNGPGIYDLELTQAYPSAEYEFVNYSPRTVRVRFDRLATQTFPLEHDVRGLTIAEGYVFDQEYLSQDRVTISGPQEEVERIERCVVQLELEEPLSATYSADLPILLLDAQGEEIDPEETHLTLNYTSAQLVVRVLKEKELPLELTFIHEPRGFSAFNDLQYNISNTSVLVAGPEDIIDRYTEIILGVIDMRDVDIQHSTFVFDVELPTDFINLENINSVTVTFDTSTWAEGYFNLDADNIRLVNSPSKYDIVLLNPSLYGVVVVGDLEVLETMTDEDIVVEVDLSVKEWQPGQYRAAVTISMPSKHSVWAVGEYSVVIQVTEIDELEE